MSKKPVEDKKFFLRQYLMTTPLNAMSLVIKLCNGFIWAIINNPQMLGFFSLASTPSAIAQRSMTAGNLVRAILPAKEDIKDNQALLQVAILVDMLLIFVFIVFILLFFWVSQANILTILGWRTLFIVSAIALLEPVVSAATHSSIAKRHYVWNFLLSNFRVLVVFALLFFFYNRGNMIDRDGVFVWMCSVFAAFFLGGLYYLRKGLNVFRTGRSELKKEFLNNIKKKSVRLLFFRLGLFFFGALPSFLISYMGSAEEVGWFSFALTLSALLYACVAPINEQVYSPVFSKLVNADDRSMLLRRIGHMTMISFALAITGSLLMVFVGKPILVYFNKLSFVESFDILPILLLHQTIILMSAGYTFSLYCMNRHRALSLAHFAAIIVAAVWWIMFRGNTVMLIWTLPVSGFVVSALCIGYVYKLCWSDKVLMSHSMVGNQ